MADIDPLSRLLGQIETRIDEGRKRDDEVLVLVKSIRDDMSQHHAHDDERFAAHGDRLDGHDEQIVALAARMSDIQPPQPVALLPAPREREPSYPSIPAAPTTGPHPRVDLDAPPSPPAPDDSGAPAIKSNVRGFSFTLTRRDLYVILLILTVGVVLLAYSPIAHDLVSAYRERGRAEMMPTPPHRAPVVAPPGDHP